MRRRLSADLGSLRVIAVRRPRAKEGLKYPHPLEAHPRLWPGDLQLLQRHHRRSWTAYGH